MEFRYLKKIKMVGGYTYVLVIPKEIIRNLNIKNKDEVWVVLNTGKKKFEVVKK